MTDELVIAIPKSFQSSLFFAKPTLDVSHLTESSLCEYPFIYDIGFELNLNLTRPWERKEESLNQLMDKWNQNSSILKELFDKRDRLAAKPIMINSIGHFIMSLFWINEKPVASITSWEEHVEKLLIKPVNTVERLSFMLSSPDHYHSFIQLTQLFEELNKQFQKAIALKNR